jgi:hypothetical protein
MKEIETNYTFNASGKTVQLNNYSSVDANKLWAIINVTRGATYYVSGSSNTITVDTNIITLNAGVSTSGHADNDTLLILYESTEILEVLQAIRRGINSLCNTIGVATPDTAGRLRVNMESGTTLSTVTTLSNISNIGGWSGAQVMSSLLNNTSANSFRTNIVVTD